MTARDQGEAESTHSGASDDGSIPNKQSCYYLRTDPVCKLHTQGAQQAVVDDKPQQAVESEQPQAKAMRHERHNGRPNSAIRLEAGRLHVNVSHRSEKRENMIAVQS